jgi:sulfur-oxidizing protein SoxY
MRSSSRRALLGGAGAGLLAVALVSPRPAAATPEAMQAAIRDFLAEAGAEGPPRPGRVRLEVPPLVENGNAVPLSVRVEEGPGGPVRAIAVFNERNPLPGVVTAHFGPRGAGIATARLATRIRLATSQRLVAVAVLADGGAWSEEAEVIVTLAACVEG